MPCTTSLEWRYGCLYARWKFVEYEYLWFEGVEMSSSSVIWPPPSQYSNDSRNLPTQMSECDIGLIVKLQASNCFQANGKKES
jgi:hypothetical protein